MVFFVLAAFSLLIPLPLVIFLMRDHPRQHKWVSKEEARIIEEGSLAKTRKVPHAAAAQGGRSYLANYRFWLATLAWGFQNIYFFGWITWMPTYLQTSRHFSFQIAGMLYSLAFFCALVAVWIVGFFSDRTMRRAPLGAASYFICGICVFLGGTVLVNPYWAVAALIIAQCGAQCGYLMNHALFQSIVPEESVGAAVGVAGGVSQLMSALSPTLIGALVGLSGFGAGLAVLGVSGLLCGACVAFLIKEGL